MEDMRAFGISISSGVDIDQNSCQGNEIHRWISKKKLYATIEKKINVTVYNSTYPFSYLPTYQ